MFPAVCPKTAMRDAVILFQYFYPSKNGSAKSFNETEICTKTIPWTESQPFFGIYFEYKLGTASNILFTT